MNRKCQVRKERTKHMEQVGRMSDRMQTRAPATVDTGSRRLVTSAVTNILAFNAATSRMLGNKPTRFRRNHHRNRNRRKTQPQKKETSQDNEDNDKLKGIKFFMSKDTEVSAVSYLKSRELFKDKMGQLHGVVKRCRKEGKDRSALYHDQGNSNFTGITHMKKSQTNTYMKSQQLAFKQAYRLTKNKCTTTLWNT